MEEKIPCPSRLQYKLFMDCYSLFYFFFFRERECTWAVKGGAEGERES